MPTEAVTEAVLVPPSVDISLVTLFLQAHIVVKVVIVGLLLASVWTWAIIVDKSLLYANIRRQMDRFEKLFWSGQSLEDLYRSLTGRTPTAMASVFVAAMREWKRSFEAGARSPIGLQIRIGHLMAQNQVVDYVEVARENPMTWLDVPVPGYRGEVVATPNPEMPAASWYYDRTQRELVYVTGLNRYLQQDAQGRPRVHFRVKIVRPDGMAARDNLVLGLQLAPVEPYRWF